MTRGQITARLDAVVPLELIGADGDRKRMEAVIDTGFGGALTLPQSVLDALGALWQSKGRAVLADGREAVFDIFLVEVVWHGEARFVLAEAAETKPLLGMSLLFDSELRIQIVEDGLVEIAQLSE